MVEEIKYAFYSFILWSVLMQLIHLKPNCNRQLPRSLQFPFSPVQSVVSLCQPIRLSMHRRFKFEREKGNQNEGRKEKL